MKNSVAAVTSDKPPESGQAAPRPDGRHSRWDAHRATRRDDLIAATIAAISAHGASVGMDQIASFARTSKPVVYRYFADKTDLYRAVSTRLVQRVLASLTAVAATDPPPRKLIHAGIDAFLGLVEQSPELYRFVTQHPQIDTADGTVADFSAVVADLLNEQLGGHLEQGRLDPAFAHPWGEGIVGFITSASLWWLDHRDAMTRQQLTAYLGALLWGGAAGVYQYVGEPADARPAAGVFPHLPG
ncbi:TetR/AcrR family transcriptional regulator [Jatrophihabitans cynanchi]|uniref:TetR/AcrR family transcriptional regulator n=1 Tax=Jatrophihabitans cynanchi TaxID=2944128 RepID=A0ABY7JT76_9ACTN|nr:TetR/AcrR family transcriptional regulator [Jatrophihabitans sp. SB3-54]WAX55235.1 TetR/AcrR family transcriptional regulator [Jatrophihabitans sp. SB3-54]